MCQYVRLQKLLKTSIYLYHRYVSLIAKFILAVYAFLNCTCMHVMSTITFYATCSMLHLINQIQKRISLNY